MLTEQSHPVTSNLSEVIKNDTNAGIKLLLDVDNDITKTSKDIFKSVEFAKLTNAMLRTM